MTNTEGRIRLRTREDMTPDQQADYDEKPTSRTNLSRLFAVADTMYPHLRALNLAMATTITLPHAEREVVALATLFLERGEYEIAQHREVARMMGFSDEKVRAIEEQRYGDPMFDARERALLAFTRQVVKSVRVDEYVYAALAAFYDDRQIVETTYVIGNYMMLARISEVAELPIDGVVGASFWKSQAKVEA
ncbi:MULTISPECIES: carboxymuconolactone decarboxylase family protein [unclassified Sphingobium]|uniref:carboxymuconolactone decarboxylase family protein n=1 Tax=unclassified Sphingobium TaxID=2611147 RepID=UPI000D4F33B5|nr:MULTISPECIES: carboxymuconolactone decarboxylase family protein [unclassified Sphingobium]MBG6119985.1 alkylhydroperoxidase family enzyme [Sphingobium sp. JAI105]PSO11848.1 hypothetical protein C7E20_10400 [Sphingobium sp. AEW4]TWC99576.1 alkylhydroperoxidase family enzyme [Sphingobium sp. AEW010]TWD18987.1 alkylhydroperoxidase family enzyme [Sphingobium sp. AEW013]TWD21858.1 alkylhydroperoxidase family enzyme [Sphingobium sp. AEW001]